jgi:hypothetical protein
MASTINANTSTGLISTADTSGILQLQSGGTTIATVNSTSLSSSLGLVAGNGIVENTSTISTNYSVSSGNNAQSIGDIIIGANVTITLGANSNWKII